jgi:hypothetical protein
MLLFIRALIPAPDQTAQQVEAQLLAQRGGLAWWGRGHQRPAQRLTACQREKHDEV